MDFNISSSIPQDLQLIQDIIGHVSTSVVDKLPSPEPVVQPPVEDSVDSSDNESDADSELEVEANILGQLDSDEESTPPTYVRRKADSRRS